MPASNSQQITTVILAGGQGKRLQGKDKGLVCYHQKPIIEHILQTIKPFTSDIFINANRNLDIYQNYGYPVIRDKLTGYQGPLAGIASALAQATTPYILTLPVDGPFITDDYLTRMRQVLEEKKPQLAVAHDGQQIQPIHALLSISLRDSLEDFLLSRERGVKQWFAQQALIEVDFSDKPEIFRNINTLKQLEASEVNTSSD